MKSKQSQSQAQATDEQPPAEDTALRSLDAEERASLSMDAWEPSLLRKLLKAQHRLRSRR